MEMHFLWSLQYGPPFIKAAMSRDRFKEIHTLFRFDDKNTRQVRRQQSLLAPPVKEVSEEMERLLKRYYKLGPFISVDEQLVGFRGRCAFRMYMPSKPDRYGLKIFLAANSSTCYPLTILPYLGQQTSDLAGGLGLGYYAVTKTCEQFFNGGRNITTDRWFTSMPLAAHLAANKTTLVGTMNTNKRCIPPQLLNTRDKAVESSKFLFQNKTTLIVSYVPKPRRSVILLSTQHHTKDIVCEEKNKPEIILFYNQTKGAVDTVDWMVKTRSTPVGASQKDGPFSTS